MGEVVRKREMQVEEMKIIATERLQIIKYKINMDNDR